MIKDKIRRFVISKKVLAKGMFRYYKIKGGEKNIKESELRKNIDLFDYKSLIKEMPYIPNDIVIDNNFYSSAFCLKRYANISKDLNSYIEHGVYFGDLVHKDELKWYTNKIITYSKNREKAINKRLPKTRVLKIGPYIHYAKTILSEKDFLNLKKSLGKVLLVFPMHTIKNIETQYDIDDFIEKIEEIRKDYNTVLISLFYLDAKNSKLVSKYESLGYKIVTSGHRFDNYFLDRQKTIISLADMTMSNLVGTHIGYCVYLNKPHYIYKQEKQIKADRKEEERVINVRNSQERLTCKKEADEVELVFSEYIPNKITDLQKKITDKYWGTSFIKTKQEILEFLD